MTEGSSPSATKVANGCHTSPVSDQKRKEWKRGEYSTHCVTEPSWIVTSLVQFNCYLMLFAAMFADWLQRMGLFEAKFEKEDPRLEGFGSLDVKFEAMYRNYIYRVSTDVVNRPICGVPGAVVRIMDRYTDDYGWNQKLTGTETDIINLGSYNYLGFSHNDGICAQTAAEYIDKYGIHCASTKHEIGNHQVHRNTEKCVARYLGVEDALIFPMGFATNAMNISSLVDKGSLILSDGLNHASLVLGCRMSGATIKVFKHNNAKDCEKKLREALCTVSSKTHKPYNKVLIIIEGIYSMEGTIVDLPSFVEVKKKYNAYLFLDEAHSVGALGPTGRGVAEYWGVAPTDIDVMMGTLTKSFASAGGYIGGKKSVIDHIRLNSSGPCYGSVMSAPLCAQVESSMKIMSGEDGTNIGQRKADQLLRNSRYFRKRLRQAGFMIYGNEDSPVVPLMTFYISKVVEFSRRVLHHRVGVVAVGFPATPLTKARIRFCLSADHTKEQLDYVISVLKKVGAETGTLYGTKEFRGEEIEY